jgi:hypothetical protein
VEDGGIPLDVCIEELSEGSFTISTETQRLGLVPHKPPVAYESHDRHDRNAGKRPGVSGQMPQRRMMALVVGSSRGSTSTTASSTASVNPAPSAKTAPPLDRAA